MRTIAILLFSLMLVSNSASAFDWCQNGTYNSGGPVTLNVHDYNGYYCVNNVDNLNLNLSTEATLPAGAYANTISVANTSSIYLYGSAQARFKDRGNAYVFSGAPNVLLVGSGMGRSIMYGGVVVNALLSEQAELNMADGYMILASATDVAKISLHGGVLPQLQTHNLTLSCNGELTLYGNNVVWTLLPSNVSRNVVNETIYNSPGEDRTYGILSGFWYDGSSFRIGVMLETVSACLTPATTIKHPRIIVQPQACGLFGIEMLPLFAYVVYRNRRKEK